MRVSVGGPCHRDMRMRSLLCERGVSVDLERGVNILVVVAGVQFHCGMHC